jgi:uncharacterized protein (DUF433 family)
MVFDLIHDRGRGPEIVGTRITVYNLLPYFLDPTATEAYICQIHELTPEQVAAARAYVLNNPETVLAKHLELEARMAAGNPRQVVEQAKQTHVAFVSFRQWLAQRAQAAGGPVAEEKSGGGPGDPSTFPTFQQWLAEHEPQANIGS